MEYLVTTPRGTYRLDVDNEEGEDLLALLDHYVAKQAVGGPGPLTALSRQQVLAQLGRPTLPEDKDHPFPEPAVVIGDEQSAGSYTRGWLGWQITAWQDARMQAKAAGDSQQSGAAETGGSAGDDCGPAAQPAAATDADTAAPTARSWLKASRQWEAPGAADGRVALVTSRGIATPSGWVLIGPLLDPSNVPRFVSWHWRSKPNELPQMWFTPEAMESIGMPVEDADPDRVSELVADTFGCTVSYSQSGFFTCRWGSDAAGADKNGTAEAAPSVANRSARLVFIPWLPLDPSDSRPGDLGVAGIEGKDTELPEDEDTAVPILAERIAWLASFGDGVAPEPRWSTVGAAFADVKRRASSIKAVKACPLPGEVVASQNDLDPDLHEGKRPHKARNEFIIVETDQRAAYLASAGSLQLGYGEPSRVDHPNAEALGTQSPPFALWRVTTPAGNAIDGLDPRLPLPHGYMSWAEPRTFWTTTRGAQHLVAPVDNGGAGLAPVELAIDAAWVWPHQHQLLRGWATEIRKRLSEAIAEGRQDRVDMLKAMYKAYLGRTASPKWSPRHAHHHQPVHYAAIQADTRFRAMKFAVHIKQSYGWYPVAADVDGFTYWLPPDADPSVLEEKSQNNGKYMVKTIEYPSAVTDSQKPGS